MPAVEQWLFNAFSVRFGAEWSYIKISGNQGAGEGKTIGVTIPCDFITKFTLDVNVTNRVRPSRNIRNLSIGESAAFFTLTFSDIFFKGK
ncbi:MAG: hypothetical protein A2452_10845 [Candidatus Firestonebacteria bacterium RIFOXYC2_FULL_39_67]|nr:MAG: hypothetical protein A2536_08745 [Candidatus Firestonebacteria bacterium RIFOXYD2_FULL_39_29]OGF55953.1 MAG: hypothetical protein A2452_10845 [Candidatus Firestonebacteria bacterium RIFOXYC2_FULL_39_67]OGF56685.1 MAG: hypothetical protein A2497_06195 [Candidatus Firestonebacteria bacterium RifOxyC12_full_39_7]